MASLIVVLCLLAASAVFVWLSAVWAARKPAVQVSEKPLFVHAINDDRCTGCDACVTVCPTDVLELIENKSRVERFSDCIQCNQCAIVCPTQALVMHPEGTTPPPVTMALLDEHYQAQPGLYLIGEAAGQPLVKNGSNLGRAVIEHMALDGLEPAPLALQGRMEAVNVLIVGSGPAGLSAALSCYEKGFSYMVIEKDEQIAPTIARWPKGKMCMAEPATVECVGHLPVWDCEKEEILNTWNDLVDKYQLVIYTQESVEEIQKQPTGAFVVRTSHRHIQADRVILAVGSRGKPRKLGVPGEHLTHVASSLVDADLHRGQQVLVVGGGDSAVEAAVALADAGAAVQLSYRGKTLSRCNAKNRKALDERIGQGLIEPYYGSQVVSIGEQETIVRVGDKEIALPADQIFVCIGGDAPTKWLNKAGIQFGEVPHAFMRESTDNLVHRLVDQQRERRKSDTQRRTRTPSEIMRRASGY